VQIRDARPAGFASCTSGSSAVNRHASTWRSDRAKGGPAKREAAAKKAAATRKRNAAKRSAAAKKGARTRAKAKS
jgi:hypothetical protein